MVPRHGYKSQVIIKSHVRSTDIGTGMCGGIGTRKYTRTHTRIGTFTEVCILTGSVIVIGALIVIVIISVTRHMSEFTSHKSQVMNKSLGHNLCQCF